MACPPTSLYTLVVPETANIPAIVALPRPNTCPLILFHLTYRAPQQIKCRTKKDPRISVICNLELFQTQKWVLEPESHRLALPRTTSLEEHTKGHEHGPPTILTHRM